MSRDTRRYEHRQWDSLIGTEQGLLAGTQHYLAARQTPGTVTLSAPGAGFHNLLAGIDVSFFGTPSGTSTVTVRHGSDVVFQAYLVAGNNQFRFNPPRLAPANTAMDIIVVPGGGTTIVAVTAGTTVPAPYRV